MNQLQVWKNEGSLIGEHNGRIEGARLMARHIILKGLCFSKRPPDDFIYFQSPLSRPITNELILGYNEVLDAWKKNKGISVRNARTKYLSELEVAFLLESFPIVNRWF